MSLLTPPFATYIKGIARPTGYVYLFRGVIMFIGNIYMFSATFVIPGVRISLYWFSVPYDRFLGEKEFD